MQIYCFNDDRLFAVGVWKVKGTPSKSNEMFSSALYNENVKLLYAGDYNSTEEEFNKMANIVSRVCDVSEELSFWERLKIRLIYWYNRKI